MGAAERKVTTSAKPQETSTTSPANSPAAEASSPVILFDGICNLCSDTVRFVLPRDRRGLFKFAALQSAAGQALLRYYKLPSDPQTLVLIEGGRTYTRSSAVLRIVRKLSGLWPLLSLFLIFPRVIRDLVYDAVARRRYGWFGKAESCFVPEPEFRFRFLDVNDLKKLPKEPEKPAIKSSGNARGH